MTREDLLLIMLAEECNEVAQKVTKALILGLDKIQEGQNYSNRNRIMHELANLIGVTQMLQKNGTLLSKSDFINFTEMIEEKMEKVEKYLEYSKTSGVLTD